MQNKGYGYDNSKIYYFCVEGGVEIQGKNYANTCYK